MLVRALLAVFAVALVLAGLHVLVRALSRGRFGNKGRLLHLVESLPLAHANALHVVRIADRCVVVASSPAGSTLIYEFAPEQNARE